MPLTLFVDDIILNNPETTSRRDIKVNSLRSFESRELTN